MVRNRSIQVCAFVVAAVALVWARPTFSQAQGSDAQFEDWVATYGDWTPAQAQRAGYLPSDVCVTAAAVGLPPETGSMGRHFVHPGYIEDGKADADAPDIVLFDAADRVVGLEFELLTVVDPIPSVGGVPMVLTPPDPGVDQDHLSLHVYFVGDPADRHSTFNPAVDCGGDAESAAANGAAADGATAGGAAVAAAGDAPTKRPKMAPAAPAAMPGVAGPSTATDAGPSTGVTTTMTLSETIAADSDTMPETVAADPDTMPETVAAASDTMPVAGAVDPDTMPVAGAGDWLPGGESTLLGALAGILVLLAAAGWMSAARRA